MIARANIQSQAVWTIGPIAKDELAASTMQIKAGTEGTEGTEGIAGL